MRRLYTLFLLLSLLVAGTSLADVYDPAYYNSQQYFYKDEIIENDFFPVMRLSELIDGYKANMTTEQTSAKYVNIEISDENWSEVMTHYFSDQRFIGREEFPVTATLSHGDGTSEIITGTMRHRGNYSTRSLKVGFRLSLNRAIQHGAFQDTTQIVFSHLVFDDTGINEYVYYQAWDKIHSKLLGFNPVVPTGDYYWVFVNGRLYGYYLVLNDSKPELLKKRGDNFDPTKDCLIKAKVWANDMSADMHYNSIYSTVEGFEKVFVIEGGDKQACTTEITQMMKDLDAGRDKVVLQKFRDPKQIAYQARYVDLTSNKTGVHQNYILFKHEGLWEIAPWDADMSFDAKYTFEEEFLHENALYHAALKAYPDELPDSQNTISRLFYSASQKFIDDIRIDRKIWSRYLPKRDSHVSDEYTPFIYPSYQPESIDALVLKFVHNTYKNIISSFY